MKKYKLGYTQGVFDMFHVGHLNLINRAKEECDYLVVGINSDDLVLNYKNKIPVVNENDRRLIVENIKAVDKAIIVESLDKRKIHKQLNFDVIFVGDDWKNNSRWIETKESLSQIGVEVVFLPYTKNISSSLLREKQENAVNDK